MRKITLYQNGSSNVEILDDSDLDIDQYCQELSKLFQMSNVSILKTSESVFIGRPSKLSGIVVEDFKETEDIVSENVQEASSPVKEEPEIQEDIITDMD
jgi:hypothetical protein